MPSRRASLSTWANYYLLFLSFAILSPYLQLYLKARGMAPSRIGVLLGSLELAGVAGPILLGRLADARSAYRGLLAAGLAVTVLAFVPLELTTAFPVYVACMFLMGFAYRATMPLLDSLVGRTLTDPAREYGRLRVAGSFGFISISLFFQLSGVVSGDSSLAILVAFGSAAGCAAIASAFLPSAPKPAHSPQANGRDPPGDGIDARFWAVMAIVFLGRFGIGAYYSFFSLYLKETFPGIGVSMIWAIGPLAEIPTIWFSGAFIRRWGIRAMLVVSLAAISLRLALFVVAPSIVVVALAQLLHAFTFGTFHTTAIAYVNEKVVHRRRGMGMAICSAVGVGLPTFMASVAGGYLLEARGFSTLFLSYAAVPIIGIVILAAFGRKLLPHERASALQSLP